MMNDEESDRLYDLDSDLCAAIRHNGVELPSTLRQIPEAFAGELREKVAKNAGIEVFR